MKEKQGIKREKRIFVICYTFLFCVVAAIVFYPFTSSGKSFVWNSDASGQYLPNLYYLYDNILGAVKNLFTSQKEILFPAFSFSAGLGADVTNNYFKGILEYLGIVLGLKNIEYTFRLIILLRIYFAGLSFGALAFYWKQNVKGVIPGALIYAFTGFTMYYGMRHMSFLIPVILLPLLLIGIEKIIRGETASIFVLCVFYSAWTDYYFLYINTLILGIYVIVRWVEDKKIKKAALDFAKIVGWYCLGIALSAVSLFPRIYKFIASGRSSTTTIESESIFVYGKNWILQFFARLISPYTTADYTKYYMLYAVSSIAIFAVIALFFEKEKKYRKLKIWVILGTLFFFVPVFAFVFSGFNSLVNRWSHAYTLLLAIVVTVTLPKMRVLKSKTMAVSAAVVGIMCLAVQFNKAVGEKSTYIGLCLLSFTLVAIILAAYISEHYHDSVIFYLVIVFVVVVNIGINGIYIYGNNGGNFVTEFVEAGKVESQYENSVYVSADIIDDNSFYRVEPGQYIQNLANAPKIYDVSGTSIYDSTLMENSLEFNEKLQNRGQVTTNNFYGFDNRSWLEALGCVGYYIASDSNVQSIPYGFELYDTKDGNKIYKNRYLMPLGYTYDAFVTESNAENMGSLELQKKMLQSAVVANDSLFTDDLIFDGERLAEVEVKYEIELGENIIWDGNKLTVKKAGANLTISHENIADTELYLMMEGMNVDDVSSTSLFVMVKENDIQKNVWLFHSLDKYSNRNDQNYCINLGYYENEGQGKCTIEFPCAGVYQVEDIRICAVGMKNYVDNIKTLTAESLENIIVEKDRVSGSIQIDQTKLLCMSLPYSKFWNAYVDGRKVETECVNYMWTGILLDSGEHTIEFVYVNKALRVGLFVSIGGLFVLVIRCGIKHKRRAKKVGVEDEKDVELSDSVLS